MFDTNLAFQQAIKSEGLDRSAYREFEKHDGWVYSGAYKWRDAARIFRLSDHTITNTTINLSDAPSIW